MLKAAHFELARESSVWLFAGFAETMLPGIAVNEVSISDAAEDLTDHEVTHLVGRLLQMAADRSH